MPLRTSVRRHCPPNADAVAAPAPAEPDDAAASRWMRRARVARAWIAVLASVAALLPALATAVEALAHALR